MSGVHDEAGACGPNSQMNFLRGGGEATSSNAPPTQPDPPPSHSSEMQPVEITEEVVTIRGTSYFMQLALPPRIRNSNTEQASPVFVLDFDGQVFEAIVAAQQAERRAVIHLDGRNWYPNLLFLGPSSKQAALTPEQWLAILPELVKHVQSRHGAYEFSRSICGLTSEGGHAVKAVLQDGGISKLFSYFALGSPEGVRPDGPSLAAKSAIALCVKAASDAAELSQARELKAALEVSRCPKSTLRQMVVDRFGEQHYHEQQTGYGVELLELPGDQLERSRRVGLWFGNKLERRKLERLGSLMPWHEFR